MRSYASIIKEIELANFRIDTFVIAPLNDELRYNKGENITHFAIGPHFSSRFSAVNLSHKPEKFAAIFRPRLFFLLSFLPGL